jgi:hypothetical protein
MASAPASYAQAARASAACVSLGIVIESEPESVPAWEALPDEQPIDAERSARAHMRARMTAEGLTKEGRCASGNSVPIRRCSVPRSTHPRNARGVIGMDCGKLGTVGKLKVGEIESRRDRAAEKAVRGVGRELDAEPRTGKDDELGALARRHVEPEAPHFGGPGAVEEQHVERPPFVEMKELVGEEAVEVRGGLGAADKKVDRGAGRSRSAVRGARLSCAVRLDVKPSFGVRQEPQSIDELARAIHGAMMPGQLENTTP